jgi:metal-responsive CopG/Arc/MetJ family transcriptional regulator
MKEEYDFSDGERGAVEPLPQGKTRITIRLDDDVLDWFRDQVHQAGGGNYQTLINRALREYIRDRKEPLEATLRRVLREELQTSSEAAARRRA